MEKYQKISVGGFLVVDGKVLIVKRSEKEDIHKGFYELPGGGVDFGEHPEQTLEREFTEETNLEVVIKQPFRVFTYLSYEGKRQTIEIVYLVESKNNMDNIKLSDEHDDFKWITAEDIDNTKITDEMKTSILEGFKLLK